MAFRSARDAFLDGEADDESMRLDNDQASDAEDDQLDEIVTPGAAAARRTHGSARAHPSASSLHPDDALKLVRSSAQLVVLSLPPRSQFGVDMWSFEVGAAFQGMKMVPEGVHFVWTAPGPGLSPAPQPSRGGASSSEEPRPQLAAAQHMMDPDMAPRLGCFAWLSSSDIWVRRWAPDLEVLVPLAEDEASRYEAGARRLDFDRGQGSYPLHEQPQWTRLTNCITQHLVERLEPVDKMIGLLGSPYKLEDKRPKKEEEKKDSDDTSMEDGESTAAAVTTAVDAAASGADAAASSTPVAPAAASSKKWSTSFYSRIPSVGELLRVQHPSVDAAARSSLVTAMHLDQTPLLDHVLAQCSAAAASASGATAAVPSFLSSLSMGEVSFLGEFQFAFVSFLVGQDYEGFEQWKRLTILLTSCSAALTARHAMYEALLSVLAAQLQSVPRDFFVDALSGDNFMRHALARLFDQAAEQAMPTSLLYALKELRELLVDKFMWRLKQLPVFKHRDEVFPEDEQPAAAVAPAEQEDVSQAAASALRAYKQRLQAEADDDEYAPTIVED